MGEDASERGEVPHGGEGFEQNYSCSPLYGLMPLGNQGKMCGVTAPPGVKTSRAWAQESARCSEAQGRTGQGTGQEGEDAHGSWHLVLPPGRTMPFPAMQQTLRPSQPPLSSYSAVASVILIALVADLTYPRRERDRFHVGAK